MSFILGLPNEAKAIILDEFIKNIEKTNSKCGTVRGTYQILEDLENIASSYGFIKCPYCGR
jgi:hypothetical protein